MKQKSLITTLFWLITICITLPGVLALLYFGVQFMAHDNDPNFMQISKCIKIGGSWNKNLGTCER